MNDAANVNLSGRERIVDPPIIDFLAHDPQLRAYVAEFIPDPHISRERKESVRVPDETATARRLRELLEEVTSLLRASARVVKIAHAGRDSFDFYTENGELLQLQDSPSPQFSFDIYAVLQVLSQEVQLEFLAQRRLGRVAG